MIVLKSEVGRSLISSEGQPFGCPRHKIRADVCFWHFSDMLGQSDYVRSQGADRKRPNRGRNDAIDRLLTLQAAN